jgi:hypothetical protein
VTIKFEFGIFEATGIDFSSIFEVKLKIDSRIANIFDFDLFSFDIG